MFRYLQECVNVRFAVVLFEGEVEDGLVAGLLAVLLVEVGVHVAGHTHRLLEPRDIVLVQCLQELGLEWNWINFVIV